MDIPQYNGQHAWITAGIWNVTGQLESAGGEQGHPVQANSPDCFVKMVGPYCMHCTIDYHPSLLGQPCLNPLQLLELIRAVRLR